MKKLLLPAVAAMLVTAWSINALNSAAPNSTTSPLLLSTTHASQSTRAAKAFAAFNRYHPYIDHNFPRLKSIQQAAMEFHTTVVAMNEVFRPYAHEDANKYLTNLKRAQTQTVARANPQTGSLVASQLNTP